MARKKKKSTAPDNFPEKWWKWVPTDWSDGIASKSEDELKQEIMKSEHIISDMEKDMEQDDKIKVLKEDLKDVQGGYTDVINTEKAKVKYSLYTLRSRGVK